MIGRYRYTQGKDVGGWGCNCEFVEISVYHLNESRSFSNTMNNFAKLTINYYKKQYYPKAKLHENSLIHFLPQFGAPVLMIVSLTLI